MKSCQEIAQLVSESHDRRLSMMDRFHVRVHMMLCAVCRSFSKQISAMRRIVARMGRDDELGHFDRCLSDDARARMRAVLSRERP